MWLMIVVPRIDWQPDNHNARNRKESPQDFSENVAEHAKSL